MRNILILLSILALCLPAKAQQLPMFGQYRNAGYVVNPAMSGTLDEEAVGVFFRYQWTRMPQSPRTGFATFDTHRLQEDNNMGISGYLLHDSTGPSMANGLAGSYAYRLEIESWGGQSHFVAFGLQLGLFQHRLNGDQLIVTDLDDPLVIGDRRSALLPEVGAGLYYYNDYVGFGVSAPQLLGMTARFDSGDGQAPIKKERHYYGMMHGKIPLDDYDEYFLMPSVWFKYAGHSPMHLDFNLRMLLRERFIVGVGYATSNALSGELGAFVNERYRFGYTYTSQFTPWSTQAGDSHEFFFQFVIEQGSKYAW